MNGRNARAIHRAARALGSKPTELASEYPQRVIKNTSHRRVVKMLKREAVLLPVRA